MDILSRMTADFIHKLRSASHSRARRWLAVFAFASAGWAFAADPNDARVEAFAGNYGAAIKLAQAGVAETPGDEEWHLLLAQTLLTVGRAEEAERVVASALTRLPQSLRLRWLARDVAFANGRPERAVKFPDEVRRLYADRPWAYRSAADLVVFGRAALLLGADPKDVLDKVYAVAQKAAPTLRDVYLARGELALEKHDFVLAAAAFGEGVKQWRDDADLNYGLARAHEDGDRKAMLVALDTALESNPRHVPSLLLLADHRIAEENYSAASKLLDSVVAVNPVQPDAWALRAVLAHLQNDPGTELAARNTALDSWAGNPRVDWLIGQKLSAKYRFTEGAAHQRRALEYDADYLPAKAQLASDLLRLGEEAEGWRLAQEVHEKDGYDVEAFNLATLHDTMEAYATMKNDDFVLRMTTHEAAVYGPQVMELLVRAKKLLTEKYGAELAKPTTVEIFADPKDFAVRTFGMPDIPGFLGVCFGRVVTANSPASTAASSTNWQSVLWHEFCHVVTLQLTKNKMPRWLSEGISVYEERQANPSWGQHMTPKYREMILKSGKDGLTPVGSMSAAFLTPPTPEHLQFAYYQASLVVEYLVAKHGVEKLRAVLRDLRDGNDINRALAQQIASLPVIEKEFAVFARELAETLAPGLDWKKPDAELLQAGNQAALATWEEKNADNYWTLVRRARRLMEEKKWQEAKAPVQRLLTLYPAQRGGDSALRLLADIHRELDDTDGERRTLARAAELDAEAADLNLRLMVLAETAKDWPAVALNARRFLEINPLVAPPWRYLAQAALETGDTVTAITANRTLLRFDPANPGEVHFQLAQLLHRGRDAEARRQVLLALEDAPRNRAALNLLSEINVAASASTAAGSASQTPPVSSTPLSSTAVSAPPSP